ncbi:MAG: glutamate--tRNA ligase [Candidatus Aureabacteria bacterium]|nr:glutamate--tRNA ligase [Candidatus Auribacterota bacterium]
MRSNSSNIRVRFAPSPTGYLHIGGARTALFNWLYARKLGGVFVLRIEDTDIQRSTQESIDAIIDNIRWLGLDWDEGPILQSQRFHAYGGYAERLVREGKAYISEEKKGAKPAVILKRTSDLIVVDDLIHGRVEFDPEVVGDLVLMKSDGTPTYNFACVVDDSEMCITHIIRGDDHLSNTPKQLVLYRALGLTPPQFAHVPLILGPDGSRLSKRHGATAVGQFREEGILPEALVNFLALLGWSPGDNREMMTLEHLVASFSLERVSKKSAVFDAKKLAWLNMQYFKLRPTAEIARMALPYLEEFGVLPEEIPLPRLEAVVRLLGERFRNLRELAEKAHYFFTRTVRIDDTLFEKHLQKENAAAAIREVTGRMRALEEFTPESLEREMRAVIAERGVKAGELIQPVRVAVTGRTETPGIFETMALLGKEAVLARLEDALGRCGKRAAQGENG